MLQAFRHGIDISRHHCKGVYACVVGKDGSKSAEPPPEVIFSLRDGRNSEEEIEPPTPGTKYGPITLSYQGRHATLRPWDPYTCVIAAGIHNRLIHFPIRPGTRIFALGCSLRTLSHIADIVGNSGAVIGVIAEDEEQRPSQAELSKFMRRHPRVSVITADVQNATRDTYERLLSLPESSRYAFLMALHPRLGENSPARLLSGESSRPIIKRIFDFFECNDAAKVKCLVVCHWPPGARVDAIREIVLNHIDILQRWQRGSAAKDAAAVTDATADPGATSGAASQDDREGDAGKSKKDDDAKGRSKSESEAEPHWVLLDLPTDRIAAGEDPVLHMKATEVVDCMTRTPSGLRTGLLAKEQLLLRPYFPNHALLLLKYAANRDERTSGKISRHKQSSSGKAKAEVEAPPAGPDNVEDADSGRPPSSGAIPVPSFGAAKLANKSAPPGPPPGLGAPPGLSAPPGLAVSSTAGPFPQREPAPGAGNWKRSTFADQAPEQAVAPPDVAALANIAAHVPFRDRGSNGHLASRISGAGMPPGQVPGRREVFNEMSIEDAVVPARQGRQGKGSQADLAAITELLGGNHQLVHDLAANKPGLLLSDDPARWPVVDARNPGFSNAPASASAAAAAAAPFDDYSSRGIWAPPRSPYWPPQGGYSDFPSGPGGFGPGYDLESASAAAVAAAGASGRSGGFGGGGSGGGQRQVPPHVSYPGAALRGKGKGGFAAPRGALPAGMPTPEQLHYLQQLSANGSGGGSVPPGLDQAQQSYLAMSV